MIRLLCLLGAGIHLCGCVSVPANSAPHNADIKAASHDHGEPTPYDSTANAKEDVNRVLAAAEVSGKSVIIAMGANWCHDSRALAANFQTPRFETLISENYELLYVDVGQKNRNIDIANRFGQDEIAGTPTVFVLSSSGQVLNADTAPTWRNAASRDADTIYEYFADYAGQ